MIRIASILLVTALPLLASAAPVRVELLPRATVEGDHVRLGDIAMIAGEAVEAASIAEITVARSPRAGLESRLSVDEVRRSVRNAHPREAAGMIWAGEAVRVERASVLLEGERIQGAAVEYLARLLEDRARDVDVTVAVPGRDLRIAKGEVVLKVRGGPERGVGTKRQSVWVDVEVGGTHERSVSVSLTVNATQEVLQLRQAKAAGQPLLPEDFEVRSIDATTLPGPAATTSLDTQTLRMKRAASAGRPLLLADVEARPQVARGETVTLKARTETVSVEALVIALDDGNRGDRVWVRHGQGGEALRATVVDAGTVELGER